MSLSIIDKKRERISLSLFQTTVKRMTSCKILLYLDGQDGWHCDMNHTCLQDVNFQLMERIQDEKSANDKKVVNLISRGRSLGQQYMVDKFAKTELSRLNYIECHQEELRAEVYSGAKDAMKSDGLGKVGKNVILFSFFTGGDRYIHQQYLDSISLYQRFGRPHFFILMTTNPNRKKNKRI